MIQEATSRKVAFGHVQSFSNVFSEGERHYLESNDYRVLKVMGITFFPEKHALVSVLKFLVSN